MADFVSTPIDQIPKIVEAARTAFKDGRTKTVEWRKTQLLGIYDMFTKESDRICESVAKDFGKPRFEAEIGEVVGIVQECVDFLGKLEKYMAPEDHSSFFGDKAFVQREPFGLCLIIAPFNYPWQLVFSPLVAAVAAGNVAVIKPSEMTPHSAALMAELVPKYLDPEAFKVINGAVPETSKLLELQFDHITYTGNSVVAKIVMAAAAKNLTPVLLELGGKSPVFVDKSADINVTATRLVFTKFFNNGQTCIAPDYIMVDESVHDKLVDAIAKQIEKNYKGNAAGSADYARIVNQRHWKRLMDVVERQKQVAGSQAVVGGTGNEKDKFIEPTVFTGVSFTDPIMEQEIFGPLMPIIKIKSIEEGLEYVNKNEHPLACYVFAKSQKVIDQVRNNTHSGGFVANNCIVHYSNHKLPFGGVGNSGLGYYHGKWGFQTFSHAKACVEQSSRKGQLDGMGPPYNLKVLDFLRFVLKWTAPSRNVKPKSNSFLTGPAGMTLVALGAAVAYYVAKVRA